jgi:hypothetical protein
VILCAIAVENVGALNAISRLVACIRRDTNQLTIHFMMTVLFSILVMLVLGTLLLCAMLPTCITNGPPPLRSNLFSSLVKAEGDQSHDAILAMSSSPWDELERELSKMGGLDRPVPSKSSWGERLRWFFSGLVLDLLLIYFWVYWVTSFTTYYESARTRISVVRRTRLPAGL